MSKLHSGAVAQIGCTVFSFGYGVGFLFGYGDVASSSGGFDMLVH